MGDDPSLLLTGGRLIDPVDGVASAAEIRFRAGRVAEIRAGLAPAPGEQVVDVAGAIVTPGLIDLHTHVYWGGTALGVDAEAYAAQSALTTLVDAGSAGAGNIDGFHTHVIAPSPVRILAYVHASFAGIYAFSRRVSIGESADLRLLSPRDAVEAIERRRDVVVGVKVRVGRMASGDQGIAPLDIALQIAEATGLPVMAHIDEPPPDYAAVVARLRPGDVLTHAFRPFPNTALTPDGAVRPEVAAARARGVLFDIGHGMASFSFATAEGLLAAGFPPDVISSDVHSLSIEGPAVDQLTTMTKLLDLGMPLIDVVRASTVAPADAIRRPDLGRLRPGGVGDASVLRLAAGPHRLVDALGVERRADSGLKALGRVVAGVWRPAS